MTEHRASSSRLMTIAATTFRDNNAPGVAAAHPQLNEATLRDYPDSNAVAIRNNSMRVEVVDNSGRELPHQIGARNLSRTSEKSREFSQWVLRHPYRCVVVGWQPTCASKARTLPHASWLHGRFDYVLYRRHGSTAGADEVNHGND